MRRIIINDEEIEIGETETEFKAHLAKKLKRLDELVTVLANLAKKIDQLNQKMDKLLEKLHR